jgi:hypothetical protein
MIWRMRWPGLSISKPPREKIRIHSVVRTLNDPHTVKRYFSESDMHSLEKRKKFFLEDMEVTITSYNTVT